MWNKITLRNPTSQTQCYTTLKIITELAVLKKALMIDTEDYFRK